MLTCIYPKSLPKFEPKDEDLILNQLEKQIARCIEFQLTEEDKSGFKTNIQSAISFIHRGYPIYLVRFELKLKRGAIGELMLEYYPQGRINVVSIECQLKGNLEVFADKILGVMADNQWGNEILNRFIVYLLGVTPLSSQNKHVVMNFDQLNVEKLLRTFYGIR